MDLINLALFLFLLASCLFAGVRASKKAPGKKIGAFIALMASFFVTTTLLANGKLDILGDILYELIESGVQDLANIASLGATVSTLCQFIARIILFDVIFWVGYLLFRLVIKILLAIIFGKRVKFFRPAESKGAKIVAGVTGGITRWFWSMFSLLPLFAILTLFTPALQTMEKQDYTDTYVCEIGQTVNKDFSFLTEKGLVLQVGKYTGANALLDYAIDSIATGTVVNAQGQETECNVHELLQNFISMGVDGAAIYELTLSGESTYADLEGAVVIIEDLTQNQVMLFILSDYLGTQEFTSSEEDPMQGLIAQLMDFYSGEQGPENIANDFSKITNVLANFVSANSDKTLDFEKITDDLVEYVLDEEHAGEVIVNLSEFSHFKETAALFVDMGVVSVCDQLGIKMDENEAYEHFTNLMLEQLNDKVTGKVEHVEQENFIKYLISADVSVSEYTESFGTDVAVDNHNRFIDRYTRFSKIIKNQYFESMDQTVLFYSQTDKCFYKFDILTERWSIYSGDVANNPSILIDFFIRQVNDLIDETNEYPDHEIEFSKEDFEGCLREVADGDALNLAYKDLSTSVIEFNKKIASKMSSVEKFETEMVFSEDVIKSINLDADLADQKDELGDVLKAGSALFKVMQNTTDEMAIIKEFSRIGTFMDALVAFELTSDIPEVLLKALAQNENLAEYFEYDSIVKILNNIKQGKSTYYELCSSIQALYNIANGVM